MSTNLLERPEERLDSRVERESRGGGGGGVCHGLGISQRGFHLTLWQQNPARFKGHRWDDLPLRLNANVKPRHTGTQHAPPPPPRTLEEGSGSVLTRSSNWAAKGGSAGTADSIALIKLLLATILQVGLITDQLSLKIINKLPHWNWKAALSVDVNPVIAVSWKTKWEWFTYVPQVWNRLQ